MLCDQSPSFETRVEKKKRTEELGAERLTLLAGGASAYLAFRAEHHSPAFEDDPVEDALRPLATTGCLFFLTTESKATCFSL